MLKINVKKTKAMKISKRPSEELLFLTISADLHGILAPEEYPNWKNQFPYSQKHSLLALQDLTTYLYLKIYFEI